MRDILTGLIIAILSFTTLIPFVNKANYYGLAAEVVELNYITDEVTVRDANGFTWVYSGCEDYDTGDIVTMVMNDKGTDFIEDDKIVNVRYSGFWTSNNPEGRG